MGVKPCRPSDVILDLLDPWPPEPFAKADGLQAIDARGDLA